MLVGPPVAVPREEPFKNNSAVPADKSYVAVNIYHVFSDKVTAFIASHSVEPFPESHNHAISQDIPKA
jgi:hypothetical protein